MAGVVSDQPWRVSFRASPGAARIADRHYSRRAVGSAQFVPPGSCLVLRSAGPGLWVSLRQRPEYTDHAWPGAWVNTLFRREGGPIASELIRAAVAATRWYWPELPAEGMVTFVDPTKVRRKRDPGRCFLRAGFRQVGQTRRGLIVLQLLPMDMPDPSAPIGAQSTLEIA